MDKSDSRDMEAILDKKIEEHIKKTADPPSHFGNITEERLQELVVMGNAGVNRLIELLGIERSQFELIRKYMIIDGFDHNDFAAQLGMDVIHLNSTIGILHSFDEAYSRWKRKEQRKDYAFIFAIGITVIAILLTLLCIFFRQPHYGF
jgi:hypothetical protein